MRTGRSTMDERDGSAPTGAPRTTTASRPVAGPAPAWGPYAALGAGLVLAASFVPASGTGARPAVYLVTAGFGTVLSIIGARRMVGPQRRIWWAFAFGQASFLAGDAYVELHVAAGTTVPQPSLADVGYLACYPALALGTLWMIRGRWRGQDRPAFLDAMIVTSGLTVVGGVLLVGPAAVEGGASLLAQAVAASYPAFDLLLLALAVRLVAGGLVRSPAMWGMLAGCALLLLADLYYVSRAVTGVPYPAWVDAVYLVSYVLYGFAAVHPSAPELSEPAPTRGSASGWGRMAWLGVALVLAPVTGQLAHLLDYEHGERVALVGGFLVAGLVVVRLADLVRDLQVKAVQLAALARRDGLTGIANRLTWEHELSRACATARETQTDLTVAILDFDHFKAYNDEHGHPAGDQVLKATSAAWAAALPAQGFVARFGGEEFAVLLPGLAGPEAVRVLERLRTAVTHAQTCSIGTATWQVAETPAALVARADQALYHAKREGRNRISIHDGGAFTIASVAAEDPLLETMSAVFQPIVDLHSDAVLAHEALSRFEGASPQEVFERALRDGTAPTVEARAVRAALAAWPGGSLLALNLSPTALVSRAVEQVLPWDMSGLIVELTETDLAECSDAVMVTLEGLRARGALLAVDDFGTGLSNVHRIAMLRPDLIKLDMSLVRGVDADPRLHGAIAATLVLAQHTGSRVIAEGIETQAERDCLVGLGVRLGQGYLIGRPAQGPVTAPDLS
ncbi:hypothetical protein CFH99_21885 [Nocardioides aromaticivorans]|uniref:Diguanylate cyclase/phosphodiesterase n=2 Tax=Nocardioides aromaticivorans TaxID=200618 RepID=A0ABX7PQJ5_9ACTN|nr:hypothetical protein CFH99_21885 [Nocardioides aromaticivorans]